ncbi:MAG: hypothetical protein IJY85_04415 [Ruminococcus sp.]|nr:hypothetical protein [Ruminococcus sp.]
MKKKRCAKLTALAVSCLLCTNMAVPFAAGADSVKGDMNGDGAVSVGDLVLLARYISQDDQVQTEIYPGLRYADVTGDGFSDATDLTQFGNYLAGLIPFSELYPEQAAASELFARLTASVERMPEYPETLEQDDWFYVPYQEADPVLAKFSSDTIPGLLTEETTENVVYSPLSYYMALSALSEMTQGDAQSELFSALGVSTADELREKNSSFFDTLYFEKEEQKCILANSAWIKNAYNYNDNVFEQLASDYRCQIYRYSPSDLDSAGALATDWLRYYTGNKISDLDITFPEDRVLTLFNTINFEDSWLERPVDLGERPFYKADGTATSAEYISAYSDDGVAIMTDRYTKVSLPTAHGYQMHFVQPAEDLTVQDLLSDSDVVYEIFTEEYSTSEYATDCKLTLLAPKFSYGSEADLIPSARELGINAVFAPSDSFAPLTGDIPLFVSCIKQEAHIAIDEIGCSAAVYTMIGLEGSCPMPEEKLELTVDLNRPFFYYLAANDGTPLFTGTINDPTLVS